VATVTFQHASRTYPGTDEPAVDALDLAIGDGEFLVLVGPSGCGKSTTLRMLAGLEPVDDGNILIGDRDVTDVPPKDRDIAMVFQSYALYPHMTVAENIGFPLKMVGTPKAATARAVVDAASRVSIQHLLERRPGQLSGGQQQRVALARAIVRQPRLFLLDEPLSNLDAKLRLETRLELRQLQRALGVTTIYVTHDQEEAMTLADRVAVFMDGRIVQVATPREIYDRPAQVTVAGFIGTPPMNLLPGVWLGNHVVLDGVSHLVKESSQQPREILLGVRPSEVRAGDAGTAARVEYIEEFGDFSIVDLKAGEQRIKLKTGPFHNLREGDATCLSFAPNAAHLFDRASGQRLNQPTEPGSP
jgi:ABC-type sugar transport system ATPase subunit